MISTRFALVALLVLPSVAIAQRKPADPVGVKPLHKLHPTRGYVDSPYAFDGPGGRLAVITTDGSTWSELEIHDLAQPGVTLVRADLTALTTTPVDLRFASGGARLFLVSRPAPDEKATGFLLDLSGKVVRKLGPAAQLALSEVNGEEVITAWDPQPDAKGGTTYDVTLTASGSGKQLAHRTLVADRDGLIDALDLTILYWRDGYTRLVGRKKGAYDKFKDQRMNDSEGIYDLAQGLLVRDNVIGDVIGYTKLMKLRVGRDNQPAFVRVTDDNHELELIGADDKRVNLKLANPIHHYDLKSLQQEPGAGGKLYFTLTIDPVNPEAVARKVADPELIDLYAVELATAKTVRLARLPRTDRPFAWHVAAGRWAVLRKHKTFERGGPDLEIYELTAK
jgi:hypothetical protein